MTGSTTEGACAAFTQAGIVAELVLAVRARRGDLSLSTSCLSSDEAEDRGVCWCHERLLSGGPADLAGFWD